MSAVAGYVAPAATMIAAMMTASNLGARVTGWGFVMFTIGSIAWSVVGISSGQQNLLLTNAFLTLVNAIGVWRWLGRQARFQDSSADVAARSAHMPASPALLPASSLKDASLAGAGGETIGTIIEVMVQCADQRLGYVVVSEGGVGGVGERLHALPCRDLYFAEQGVSCDLTAEALRAMPEVHAEDWPISVRDRRLS